MVLATASPAVFQTQIDGLAPASRGKVRDIYDLGDTLLIVATDRLSAFDVVFPTPIPQKGRVLTQMTLFWLNNIEDILPNHLISAEIDDVLDALKDAGPGTWSLCTECWTGVPCWFVRPARSRSSAWCAGTSPAVCGRTTQRPEGRRSFTGTISRAACWSRASCRNPIFTPATKATSGHDENISVTQAAGIVGQETFERLESLSLAIYKRGRDVAAEKGIIIADTKFEFGLRDGEIILIDELLTPDSSRFWDYRHYQPGKSQESFDKQYVRDWLEARNWDKKPPAPELPDDVVAGTTERYLEAYRRSRDGPHQGMKHILLVFDGMSDFPLEELEGRTPMMVANTPYMDDLASKGMVGKAVNHPPEMYAGSDTCNMSILGYDPAKYGCGRGPLEAASIGIPLNREDVAYRCNLITTDGERMIDSSAGHIGTEAPLLIGLVAEKLGGQFVQFYPAYRTGTSWSGAGAGMMSPARSRYKHIGETLAEIMPEGDGEEKLRRLIWDSHEILDGHKINRRRRDEGKEPANMVWFWGQGRAPELPSFFRKHGKTGAVVAAVDLVRGIGRLVGLDVIDVPGATGYIDTNYVGKGEYAFQALEDHDFVLCTWKPRTKRGTRRTSERRYSRSSRWTSTCSAPFCTG